MISESCFCSKIISGWFLSKLNTSSKIYPGSLGAFTLPCKQVISVQDIKLPAKVAQGVSRKLSQDWKSVIALRKKGLKTGSVRYKKTYSLVEYNPQAISTRSLKKGYLCPTGWSTGVKLPPDINVRSARIHLGFPASSGHVICHTRPG